MEWDLHRWLAANVIFLRSRPRLAQLLPIRALATVVAALFLSTVYGWWSGFIIDGGQQKSPQEIFFGTFDTGGSSYSLVHLLQKAISGLVRFRRDSAPIVAKTGVLKLPY